jgi:hypothetical protein
MQRRIRLHRLGEGGTKQILVLGDIEYESIRIRPDKEVQEQGLGKERHYAEMKKAS